MKLSNLDEVLEPLQAFTDDLFGLLYETIGVTHLCQKSPKK